jgi:hypothetical protein
MVKLAAMEKVGPPYPGQPRVASNETVMKWPG